MVLCLIAYIAKFYVFRNDPIETRDKMMLKESWDPEDTLRPVFR